MVADPHAPAVVADHRRPLPYHGQGLGPAVYEGHRPLTAHASQGTLQALQDHGFIVDKEQVLLIHGRPAPLSAAIAG